MNTLMLILGAGGGATILLRLIDIVRNFRYDKRKQDSTIKLDDAQYAEITSRAEQTSSASLMAVGAFWQGQFSEMQKVMQERLDAETKWRTGMTTKLKAHEKWDRQLMKMLEDCDMHIPPPPSLDPDN